jgi:hypothetical protein
LRQAFQIALVEYRIAVGGHGLGGFICARAGGCESDGPFGGLVLFENITCICI